MCRGAYVFCDLILNGEDVGRQLHSTRILAPAQDRMTTEEFAAQDADQVIAVLTKFLYFRKRLSNWNTGLDGLPKYTGSSTINGLSNDSVSSEQHKVQIPDTLRLRLVENTDMVLRERSGSTQPQCRRTLRQAAPKNSQHRHREELA